MTSDPRQLAIITGASAGIGYELAKCCAQQHFDLLIAADQPAIHDAAQDSRVLGARLPSWIQQPPRELPQRYGRVVATTCHTSGEASHPAARAHRCFQGSH
jgi:NAD(P)-dependent dehydrogenase (short-subunit alcohol dehydrogenase family)